MRGHAYDDLVTPLRLLTGAREGLAALKRAGHTLILFSARANRALREDPTIDPLARAGVRKGHRPTWEANKELNQARYQQMIDFVAKELPGVFSAIDDGMQGKPVADLFLDDRGLRLGVGPLSASWATVSQIYGEPAYNLGGRL